MPGLGGTLDGRSRQTVDTETIAQQLEQSQFILRSLSVGGDNVARENIGRFAQSGRQRPGDPLDGEVDSIDIAEKLPAFIANSDNTGFVECFKHGQCLNETSHRLQFDIADLSFGDGYKNHRVDEGGMRIESLSHVVPLMTRHTVEPSIAVYTQNDTFSRPTETE